MACKTYAIFCTQCRSVVQWISTEEESTSTDIIIYKSYTLYLLRRSERSDDRRANRRDTIWRRAAASGTLSHAQVSHESSSQVRHLPVCMIILTIMNKVIENSRLRPGCTAVDSNNRNSTGWRSPQSLHSERVHCWRPLANEIKLRRKCTISVPH